MEPIINQELDLNTDNASICTNCGSAAILKEFPTPLCAECREKFIKFPIPIWIKIFAGAIILLVILNSVLSFDNITMGLHLERGIKAEKNKKYITAAKEFNKVLKKNPDNTEVKVHLMIAAFYNEDITTFAKLYREVENKQIEDKELFTKIDNLIPKAVNYLRSDSFSTFVKQHLTEDSLPDENIYKAYLSKTPGEVAVQYELASYLYDKKNYSACDSVLNVILTNETEFLPAFNLMAASKREQGDWASSIMYSEKILAVNKEASSAVAAEARVLLKQYKDKEALETALKAYKINDKDNYTVATLALVYHFTGQAKQRDKIIAELKSSKDSMAHYYMSYPISVIEGKEIFRK